MSAPRITTADASIIYNIPARTLRRWHTEGRITAHRDGRNYTWDCAELDQLADQRAGYRLPRTPLMTHHQQ